MSDRAKKVELMTRCHRCGNTCDAICYECAAEAGLDEISAAMLHGEDERIWPRGVDEATAVRHLVKLVQAQDHVSDIIAYMRAQADSVHPGVPYAKQMASALRVVANDIEEGRHVTPAPESPPEPSSDTSSHL
jgi:hypothetical protein